MKKTFGFILFALIILVFFQKQGFAQSEETEILIRKYYYNGSTANDDGKYEQAITWFNKAIALDSSKAYIYKHRGHSYNFLKSWENALADYARAIELAPEETYEVYFQSGEILQKGTKQLQKAIKMYDKAIEMLEKSDDGFLYLAYFNRGNSYLKLENYPKAVASYTKAVHIFPEHGNSYINRGFAQYNQRNKDFACADWQKANELGVPMAKDYIDEYCR